MQNSIIAPLAALGFCVWAVYLGGLASLQSMCVDNSSEDNTLNLLGAWGFSAYQPCSRVFSFYWFIMSFEIVALVGLGLVSVSTALKTYRVSFLALFSVLTLLYINATHAWLDAQDLDWYNSGTQLDRIRTVTAGALMTAVVNGFIIIALGVEPSPEAAESKAESKPKDIEMAPEPEVAAPAAPAPTQA